MRFFAALQNDRLYYHFCWRFGITGTDEDKYTRIPNAGKLLFILYEITIASSQLERYDEILFIDEPY